MKTILTLRTCSALLLAGLAATLAPLAHATLFPLQQVQSSDFTTSAALNQAETQSGRAVAASGNWMAIGAPGRPDTARGSVTVYERIAGVWTRRATLLEPTPQFGTGFGSAVDIDEVAGRVSVVVGAPLFDQGIISNAGAVWFYTDQDAGPGVTFPAVGAGSTSSVETDGRFGTAVALQGDWAAVSEPGDGNNDNGLVSIRFRNQNGTNGWGQTVIKSGNGNGYGFSLDLHGEYLIVGVPQAANAVGVASGQAIVYRRDEGFANSWGQSWVLSPASPQDGAGFGTSVGIWDSDLSTTFTPSRAMVGAPQTVVSGFAAVGAVHFFQDAASVSVLSPAGSSTTRGGQAGYSVALEAGWALAGAPGLSTSAGRVHSYGFSGSTWATASTDIAQTPSAAGNQYGWSVDVSGDLGVAGAPGSRFDSVGLPPGVPRAGSANALLRTGAACAFEATLDLRNTLPVTAVNQSYGGAVAMTADWLAIGTPQDAQQGSNAGAVYLYRRNGDNWVAHSKLTHPYSQPEQRFGQVLAIDGDRLVVGLGTTSSFPAALAGAGTAVFYRFDGTAWAQVATLSSPNAVVNGNFGASVDIAGDILAIGAPGELADRGRIYVYRDLVGFSAPQVLEINGTVAGDRTATSLAAEDLLPGVPNNETIAVGIPNVGGGVGIGLVLYGANFSIRTPLIDPAAVQNGRMGTFIDVDQNRVIIARMGTSLDQARAYVYSGSFYQTREALPLPAGLPTATALPVSLHGNTAVVGLRDVDNSRGRAFGFRFSGSTWSLSDNVQPANTLAGDQYGGAVATYAGRAVIGAPLHDPAGLANAGTAYLYLPAPEFQFVPATVALSETAPTDGSTRVTLNRAPLNHVSFTLSFDSTQVQVNTGAGFGSSPQTVTLTPANALTGVLVSLRVLDDAIDETTPHAVTLTTSDSSSSDPLFNGLVIPDPFVSIEDNDAAGVRLQRSAGNNAVGEGGSSDSYTVVLTSQPTAPVDVAISFASGDLTVNGDGDGGVALTFSTSNWNLAQTVHLAAVNDRALEGDEAPTVSHVFSSADPNYRAITARLDGSVSTNVMSVQISDNETGTIGWTAANQSAPEGGSATPQVRLQISANGTGNEVLEAGIGYQVQLATGTASAADLGTLSGPLSFDAGSPNGAANGLQLPLPEDALAEPSETYTLTLTGLSGLAGITLAPATQAGNIIDNDVASVGSSQSGGTTAVTEGGASDDFGIVLTSEPFAPVTVMVITDSQLDVQPAVLNFDAGNWNQPQGVQVSARNDAVAEGNHGGTLTFAVSSTDSAYQGFVLVPVPVAITDNDFAGLTVAESAGSTTVEEGGAGDHITVSLTSQPVSSVQVTVAPDAQLAGAPVVLTFTAVNWQDAQTVPVSAVDDVAVEGAHTGVLSFQSSSSDAFYQGLVRPPLSVAILDNDSIPEVTVLSPPSRQQGSPGSISMLATVTDAHQPAGALVVSVAPGGTAQGITIEDLANVDGVVSARLTATCTATAGTIRLRVTDAGNLSAEADVAVNVLSNTPPQLGYGLAAVVLGGQTSVSPTGGPTDNGTVESVVVQSSGSFTGSAAVLAGGVVQLSGAGPVGTHLLQIRSTDQCAAHTDTPLSVDVGRAQSFKRVTVDVAPSRFGQPVTFSAELAGVNPSGSVQFFAGTTALGSAPLQPSASGGNNLKLATLTTSVLPVGLSQVRVEYPGDDHNLPASSGDLPHTVLPAATRVHVHAATQPAPVGAVVLQVQVWPEAPGGGVPAGTVLLASGPGNACTASLAAGQGACTLNFTSAGYQLVAATYTPSGGNHQPSGAAGAVVVVADPSSTDLRVRIGNGVSTVQPGQALRYLIVAENLGSTAAVGRLQVPIGAGFGGAAWRCLSAAGATCPAAAAGTGDLDVDLGLDAGAVVLYELLVLAPPPPEAPIAQSAQLSLRAPTTDPQPANNQAVDLDPMGLFADGYEDARAEE